VNHKIGTIYFDQICWTCKKQFINNEFVNIVKLDDGTIHYVHGGKCADVPIGKHRLPMRNGDWWIRRVGIMQPYLEVNPEYTKILKRTMSE
jgi:hypothetical protein